VRAQDFAILCRTNEQPRAFETELRRAKLPYVLLGGMSFFDRKEIRDLLAYLKVLENPRDEPSLLRIINTPARNIGASTVKQLVAAATATGSTMWEIMGEASKAGLNSGAADAVQKFRLLILSLQKAKEKLALAELASEVIAETGYRREIDRQYPDPNDREARAASLEEIVNAAAAYEAHTKKPSLQEFLDDIALGGRDSTDDKENQLQNNAIALMTLHSAKGLEFPYVYMVGMEEGILPHRRSVELEGDSIDEERRLCYVGVTRAREQLTLSFALTRRKWGKPRATVPSRFLYEMTGQAENARKKEEGERRKGEGIARR
jgi:DNA helicase-2/ATP-dependent DNA helicase PcrA